MAEAPTPSSRPVPPRVGRYDVLLPIASGGMATVYLARSLGARGFAKDVALKLTHAHLTDESSDFAAILVEEARIASRIKHRNVVSILDVGEDPLGLFLVMDYVEGDTLAGLQRSASTRSEPLPARIGVRILLDALAGLHAAHELTDEQGNPMAVVHRDFSPQNILIGLDGVAQLADFGIAKAADRLGETATGVVKGKVVYMSPEHARSQPIDRRADVWSAGVVAWEIFAGHRLYPTNEGVNTAIKVISERPPLLRSVVKIIRPEVEAVVARALQPDLNLRCPTAAAFARDLANAFGSMGRLAEHEEVAEYVSRMAGPKLEKRRVQMQSALKRQAEMAAVTGGAVAGSSQRPSQLSEPPPPVAASPRTSTPTLQSVVPDVAPSARAAVPAEPDATVSRPLSLPSTQGILTETVSASDTLHRALPSAWIGRTSDPRWLGGALGIAVATLIGLLVFGRGSGRSIVGSPPTPGETAPASVPPPASPPIEETSLGPTRVELHANAKLGSVRINARTIAVVPPATDVSFERSLEEAEASMTVVATAVDGRKRAVTLAPGATASSIDFPAFPQRPSLGTPLLPASAPAPR